MPNKKGGSKVIGTARKRGASGRFETWVHKCDNERSCKDPRCRHWTKKLPGMDVAARRDLVRLKSQTDLQQHVERTLVEGAEDAARIRRKLALSLRPGAFVFSYACKATPVLDAILDSWKSKLPVVLMAAGEFDRLTRCAAPTFKGFNSERAAVATTDYVNPIETDILEQY